MAWEFSVLHALQNLHTPALDIIMKFVSLIGEAGAVWIVVSVILAFFPKTRKCAIMMMASMALTYVLGNLILKNLIARPRPFMVDDTVKLIVKIPSEYSFPSGHTMNGFTAAFTIFLHNRKAGLGAFALAALIAFSRMYLFVHYPTDILGGIVVGIADAFLVALIAKIISDKRENKSSVE